MKLFDSKEYTALMLIKADGMDYLPHILQVINKHELTILACKTISISEMQAKTVYQVHAEKYFFPSLVEYLTMAPSFVLALKGAENNFIQCKKEIRNIAKTKANEMLSDAIISLLDKKSSQEGRQENLPKLVDQFRGEFFNTFDGIHCSDRDQGARELAIFFDLAELKNVPFDVGRASEIICGKLVSKNVRAELQAVDQNNIHNAERLSDSKAVIK